MNTSFAAFSCSSPLLSLTQLTNLLMISAKERTKRVHSELAVVVFVVVVVARWAVVIFLEHAHGTGCAVTHLLLVVLEEGRAADHGVDCDEAEQDVEGDSW